MYKRRVACLDIGLFVVCRAPSLFIFFFFFSRFCVLYRYITRLGYFLRFLSRFPVGDAGICSIFSLFSLLIYLYHLYRCNCMLHAVL